MKKKQDGQKKKVEQEMKKKQDVQKKKVEQEMKKKQEGQKNKERIGEEEEVERVEEKYY